MAFARAAEPGWGYGTFPSTVSGGVLLGTAHLIHVAHAVVVSSLLDLAPPSVPEVARPREHHGHPVLVAAVDAVLVAEGAAGVDDGGDARLAGFFD